VIGKSHIRLPQTAGV